MQARKYFLYGGLVFLLQLFLAEYLSIRSVRPDLVLVFILYLAVWEGSFVGVIAGFGAGILVDLVGQGSLFGLSSLGYSLTGYLAGFLQDKYQRWTPLYFHSFWIAIVGLRFFVNSFFRSYSLFVSSQGIFWEQVGATALYTGLLIVVANIFIPLGKST